MTEKTEKQSFIEKVIEENKEGLTRLAREEDAEMKRKNKVVLKVRKLLRKLKREEDQAEFIEID